MYTTPYITMDELATIADKIIRRNTEAEAAFAEYNSPEAVEDLKRSHDYEGAAICELLYLAGDQARKRPRAANILEALDVLDAQYEHTKGAEAAGVGAETQRAYYAGCRLMLEVVAGYDIDIQRDEQTGKHRAIRREAAR